MQVSEIFEPYPTKRAVYESFITEGICESMGEVEVLLESAVPNIKAYAERYRGNKAPDIIAYQSMDNDKHQVVFLIADRSFHRIEMFNGRVVEDEQLSNFRAATDEMEFMTPQLGWNRVDTRSYLRRNWQTILTILSAGALTAAALSGLAVVIMAAGSFIAGLAKLGLVLGGVTIAASVINHFKSGTPSVPYDSTGWGK